MHILLTPTLGIFWGRDAHLGYGAIAYSCVHISGPTYPLLDVDGMNNSFPPPFFLPYTATITQGGLDEDPLR
jgi:hypothetical protein